MKDHTILGQCNLCQLDVVAYDGKIWHEDRDRSNIFASFGCITLERVKSGVYYRQYIDGADSYVMIPQVDDSIEVPAYQSMLLA